MREEENFMRGAGNLMRDERSFRREKRDIMREGGSQEAMIPQKKVRKGRK